MSVILQGKKLPHTICSMMLLAASGAILILCPMLANVWTARCCPSLWAGVTGLWPCADGRQSGAPLILGWCGVVGGHLLPSSSSSSPLKFNSSGNSFSGLVGLKACMLSGRMTGISDGWTAAAVLTMATLKVGTSPAWFGAAWLGVAWLGVVAEEKYSVYAPDI